MEQVSPLDESSYVFWLIPVIIFLGSTAMSYFIGSSPRQISVGPAFPGGAFMRSPLGMFSLIAGEVPGFFARSLPKRS